MCAWAGELDADDLVGEAGDDGSDEDRRGSIRNEYASGLYHYVEWWYEVAPPSGSQTINVAYSGNMSSDAVAVMYLSGVHQGSPVGASGTNTGSGTTLSIGVTTGTAQSWVVAGDAAAGERRELYGGDG